MRGTGAEAHRLTTIAPCTRIALYAVAVSFATAEGCSISAAVNRLLRRGLPGAGDRDTPSIGRTKRRNGILVSMGGPPITAETIRRIEEENDAS